MGRSLSSHQKIIQLQRKLFDSLQSEAKTLLGEVPASIRQYSKENQRDFTYLSKDIKTIPKSKLIEIIQNTDVSFIADFHTFNQAQRTALRIMREAINPKDPWMIGLEMIPSQFQNILDQFQRGEISLSQFHSQIDYSNEWGFPWENYEPLFAWARENHIRLIALNRPRLLFNKNDFTELKERDQWAAGIITDIFSSYPLQKKRLQMIVLYGDLHVGSYHLPLQLSKLSRAFLKKPLSSLSIHQNNDNLFWKISKKEIPLDSTALQLKKNIYCIFSSTPWAKLQSLVNWVEEGSSKAWGNNEETDYLSTLRNYGHSLSEFFGVPAPHYESLTLCTADQIKNSKGLILSDPQVFSQSEHSLIRFLISNNQRFYSSKGSVAYLGSPSYNSIAELAALHMIATVNRSSRLLHTYAEDFYRVLIESVFGFFGSLILNPNRKCDLPQDHRGRIEILKSGATPSFPQEFEVRTAIVSFFNDSQVEDPSEPKKHSAASTFLIARWTGHILAKQLHLALVSEKVTVSWIREFFFTPTVLSPITYRDRLQQLKQKINSVPLPDTKNEFRPMTR